MPFNMFPYSNLHNLNLDWILNTVKTMAAAVEAAATTVETYAARLSQVETDVQAITPAATGAVRHDVSQSLDTANRRRAAVNIHAVSYDAVLLSADEKAQARSNIGAAASSAIPDVSDVIRYSAQSLTDGQKQQARTNIGAISSSDIPPAANAVLYTEQSLTALQKAQARSNIEAVSSSQYNTLDGRVQTLESSAVKYTSQSLTNEQKAQARTNIGAISSSDIPPAPAAVLYTAQELTDAQKQQARENIQAEYEQLHILINNPSEGVYTTSANFDDVVWAAAHNIPIWIYLTPYGETATYIGLARMINNAQGYESIGATLTLQRVAADSLLPETWYNVSWLDGNPAPVLTVTTYQGRMVPNPTSNDAGKVLAVNSLGRPGWEDKGPVRNTVSGATPTITPADNHIYICGTVTDLTVDTFPATGMWSIIFVSGATATSTDFPVTLNGLDDFVPETNTRYEINVLDGWAVVGSWAVTV